MAKTTHFVGLDVHARQTHAGVLEPDTGELWRRRLSGDPLVALPLLEKLGPGALAVYEAGPTGFGLARAAAERGLDVSVWAPGLIPSKPADHFKTDPRDGERIAPAARRRRALLRARPERRRGAGARPGPRS